ncbi:hypothetical protein ACFL6G_05630 [candidate division KSB1 bacterium]
MSELSRREEQVLLAVGNLKDEAYLLAIKEYLAKTTNKDWSVGIIHKPLLQLERKRYIRSFMSEATAKRGGRRKKIYEMTRTGLDALKELREEQDVLWQNFLRTAEPETSK